MNLTLSSAFTRLLAGAEVPAVPDLPRPDLPPRTALALGTVARSWHDALATAARDRADSLDDLRRFCRTVREADAALAADLAGTGR